MQALSVEGPSSESRKMLPRACPALGIVAWLGCLVVGSQSGLLQGLEHGTSSPTPLLGDGTAVDWWFAFKPTTDGFDNCSTTLTCMFGGDTQSYRGWGLQYILSFGCKDQTSAMQLHSDCLGNGEDPVAKTFAQVYSGRTPNYVIWNDQFYDDPKPNIQPPCVKYCAGPWGHSKGVMAWGEDGAGFVMQVTTPDWPGSGSSSKPRDHQGNTLGCCKDDNIKVAQHFFALRLATKEDTKTVLLALQRASAVTDPNNDQLVKLSSGPSELSSIAKQLGRQVLNNLTPLVGTLTMSTSSPLRLIAKPSGLHVPPWHMVSSLLGAPLRTASWWTEPEINSTRAGFLPLCWNKSMTAPQEVQVALSGQWNGKNFSLKGRPTNNGNHAKLAHSLSGPKLTIMADMNQQGSLNGNAGGDDSCEISQNGRGGLFFVMEDEVLHSGLSELLHGATADYVGSDIRPSPSFGSAPSCGGAEVSRRSCKKRSNCTYVDIGDAQACGVQGHGCYAPTTLPAKCPNSRLWV